MTLAKKLKCYCVQSLNGGLHLYFKTIDVNITHQINTTLKCLIPKVDIIKNTIIGPNFSTRPLIFSKLDQVPTLPDYFYPLDKNQNKKLVLELKKLGNYRIFLDKGCRRKTLISLIKLFDTFSPEIISFINDNIFITRKTNSELKTEILDRISTLVSKQSFQADTVNELSFVNNILWDPKYKKFYQYTNDLDE